MSIFVEQPKAVDLTVWQSQVADLCYLLALLRKEAALAVTIEQYSAARKQYREYAEQLRALGVTSPIDRPAQDEPDA